MAEVIQINSNTYRIEDGFVRFFLLVGKDKAMMIDSGINSKDALDLCKSSCDKPIILLNTHGDGDHTSGTASFKEIYIHKYDYLDYELEKKYPNTKLKEINDGDIIELGDRPIKVIHIPGHTRGSVALLDINNRVLYSGDSVQKGNIFMFGKTRVKDKFVQSLDKLISIKDEYDIIYASHDKFDMPSDYVEKVKESFIAVLNNEVKCEMIDLFGSKVKSYSTKYCGFYME